MYVRQHGHSALRADLWAVTQVDCLFALIQLLSKQDVGFMKLIHSEL